MHGCGKLAWACSHGTLPAPAKQVAVACHLLSKAGGSGVPAGCSTHELQLVGCQGVLLTFACTLPSRHAGTETLCLGPEVPLDDGWLPLPSFLPAAMCHRAVAAAQDGSAVHVQQPGWTWLANDQKGEGTYEVRGDVE